MLFSLVQVISYLPVLPFPLLLLLLLLLPLREDCELLIDALLRDGNAICVNTALPR